MLPVEEKTFQVYSLVTTTQEHPVKTGGEILKVENLCYLEESLLQKLPKSKQNCQKSKQRKKEKNFQSSFLVVSCACSFKAEKQMN